MAGEERRFLDRHRLEPRDDTPPPSLREGPADAANQPVARRRPKAESGNFINATAHPGLATLPRATSAPPVALPPRHCEEAQRARQTSNPRPKTQKGRVPAAPCNWSFLAPCPLKAQSAALATRRTAPPCSNSSRPAPRFPPPSWLPQRRHHLDFRCDGPHGLLNSVAGVRLPLRYDQSHLLQQSNVLGDGRTISVQAMR